MFYLSTTDIIVCSNRSNTSD